ncbi:MAG: pre-toxin TG domain-containing protein, partial [Eubacteriales bacterium]
PFGLCAEEDNFGAGDAASIAADLTPVAGNVKSLIQVFTGTDTITGKKSLACCQQQAWFRFLAIR